MTTATLDPAVRHDMVFFFDVTDGNPNGDPDNGNRPRTDDETGHGLVTDVAVKRKVRDTIGLAAQARGLDLDRFQIFVEVEHALNTRLEESYVANGIPLDSLVEDGDDAKVAGAKKKKTKRLTSASDARPAKEWLTRRYVDIRLFGAVMSTGSTYGLGKIRGPLQFGMARSVDPVAPVSHAITRVTQTTQADIDKGQSTEMGSKWTIPYGLYRMEIHYSGIRGTQTGVSAEDLDILTYTLINMFDHDRSASRGEMNACGLYVFSHDNAFGSAPAHLLSRRVQATHIGQAPVPRTIDDYKVDVDDAGLPAGVTLTRVLG